VEVVGHGKLPMNLADIRGRVPVFVMMWCVPCVVQNGVKWIVCDGVPIEVENEGQLVWTCGAIYIVNMYLTLETTRLDNKI
jgi:hypothetical protein